MRTQSLYLVACVAKKLNISAPARDLYISTWFTKAKCYVEQQRCSWFILSAEHGLLKPNQITIPYNKSLTQVSIQERRLWTAKVINQMQSLNLSEKRIVILAGQRYRELLVPELRRMGAEIEIPMAGLSIGQQLQWLNQQIKD